MDAILEKHEVIKSYIGTKNLGLRLKAVDSEIMSIILDKLTTLNIPVLPVHDSIIFRVKDKELAIQTMAESFKEITGFDAQIKWPYLGSPFYFFRCKNMKYCPLPTWHERPTCWLFITPVAQANAERMVSKATAPISPFFSLRIPFSDKPIAFLIKPN